MLKMFEQKYNIINGHYYYERYFKILKLYDCLFQDLQ